LADFKFALTATETRREERLAKLKRTRCRGTRWLLVAGLVLLMMNFLACMAYLLLSFAEHSPAF